FTGPREVLLRRRLVACVGRLSITAGDKPAEGRGVQHYLRVAGSSAGLSPGMVCNERSGMPCSSALVSWIGPRNGARAGPSSSGKDSRRLGSCKTVHHF